MMPPRGALGAYIRIDGLQEALTVFDSHRQAAVEMGRTMLAIGSPLRYARPVEARRHMLRDGIAAMQREIPALVAAEFEKGAGIGQRAEDAIRRTALTHVQRRTPVVTGKLRDSFTVKRGRR
jgi:hypothetical protein